MGRKGEILYLISNVNSVNRNKMCVKFYFPAATSPTITHSNFIDFFWFEGTERKLLFCLHYDLPQLYSTLLKCPNTLKGLAVLGLRSIVKKILVIVLTHRYECHFYVLTASGSIATDELTRVND